MVAVTYQAGMNLDICVEEVLNACPNGITGIQLNNNLINRTYISTMRKCSDAIGVTLSQSDDGYVDCFVEFDDNFGATSLL